MAAQAGLCLTWSETPWRGSILIVDKHRAQTLSRFCSLILFEFYFPDHSLWLNFIKEIILYNKKGAIVFCVWNKKVEHMTCTTLIDQTIIFFLISVSCIRKQIYLQQIVKLKGFKYKDDMSRRVTKPTMWLCAQRRLRSAWASAQSDQSTLCAQWVAKGPSRFMWTAKTLIIWVFAGRTATLLVLGEGV